MLYALVLGPAIWTLSAVAFTQHLTGRGRAEQTVEALAGFLLLLLAGAAYALLLLPRLSPVGPVATGAVFLAASIWVLIDRASFRALWPGAVTKSGFDLPLPAEGLAALLAVPLLCTALSARRWRASRPAAPDDPGTFVWPFARPAHTGTLVVPGVTGVATADATQVLPQPPVPTTPAADTEPVTVAAATPPVAADTQPLSGDRTQVVAGAGAEVEPAGDTTRLPDAVTGTPPGPPAQRDPNAADVARQR